MKGPGSDHTWADYARGGLEDRVALVTGAGRGIGQAIARALAAGGALVAVNDRDAVRAGETVKLIEAHGGAAVPVPAAVDDPGACTAAVGIARREAGPVDILVSNAGIASSGAAVVDTDDEELRRVLSVNAVAAFQLCRAVLPDMRARRRGHVVMVSSATTRVLPANGAPYSMAKAALEALCSTLAKEERANGIRVNAVRPGLVDTATGRRFVRANYGIDDMAELDARSPFGRTCRPFDVAHAVRWLVSDAAAYVTGHVLDVDGGG